jgi:high affinity sulfate transporter 1
MNIRECISIPLLADLRQYQPKWLMTDAFAGLSVAAVQVPTAVAYAQLAGFSPEVGLYASILPVIVYALFGSSRQLVVGPDAATCTMVASVVGPLAGGDPVKYIALSAGLSLAAGILMIIGGLSGMGFIVNFFARPILIGFLNGIAASIIVGQMGKVLGFSLKGGDFVPTIMEMLSKLPTTHSVTLVVGLSTLIILALLKKFAPKAPSSLIALAIASVALFYFGGSEHGVALIGSIPAGLPRLGLPTVSYHSGQGLFVSALGLVIVSFTSGMLTARSFAARAHESIDPNREMFALGAANLASGLSGAFAITGADSRTAVNFSSGNKTQLASIFAALATAAVAAFFTQPLGYLPHAALAAVLIFSAAQLFDFKSCKELISMDVLEFRLCLLTTAGVLGLGVLPGVALAILFALLIILVRIYRPDDAVLGVVPGMDGYNDVTISPDSASVPGLILWRFEGPLVFFNAEYFKTRILQLIDEANPPPEFIVVSLESVSQLDTTGFKALTEVAEEVKSKGVKMLLARPKAYMGKYRDLESAQKEFADRVFPSLRAAVEFATTVQA